MSLNNINYTLTRLIIMIVLLVTLHVQCTRPNKGICLVFDEKSTVLRVIIKVTEKLLIIR